MTKRPDPRRIDRKSGVDPRDHLGLAWQACRKLAQRLGSTYQAEDFIGEAYIILCDAARTFDPAKGYRFSTHAVTALHLQLWGRWKRETGHYRTSRGTIAGLPVARAVHENDHDRRDDEVDARERQARRRVEAVAEFARDTHPHAGTVIRLLGQGLTLKQAGRDFGYSRERVRQIRNDVQRDLAGFGLNAEDFDA